MGKEIRDNTTKGQITEKIIRQMTDTLRESNNKIAQMKDKQKTFTEKEREFVRKSEEFLTREEDMQNLLDESERELDYLRKSTNKQISELRERNSALEDEKNKIQGNLEITEETVALALLNNEQNQALIDKHREKEAKWAADKKVLEKKCKQNIREILAIRHKNK